MKLALFIFGLSMLILSSNTSFAESKKYANIISYDWKITEDESINLMKKDLDISDWDNINIGISWERQGYFGASGELIIANRFELPDMAYDYSGASFNAIVNLQCNVIEVYLNGEKIAENLAFNKTSPNRFEIPVNKLKSDAKNLLAVRID